MPIQKGRSNAKHQKSSTSKYKLQPRRAVKVPRIVRDGLKRKPIGGLQCKICHRYFKGLPELNVHYAVRKDHNKESHPPKAKSFARRLRTIDKTISDKDIEEASVIYLALKHPEELKKAIDEELARRFRR